MDLKNKHNFSKDELIACSNGDLFGPGNGRLPNNEMLMMDRIVEINDSKGDYNIGEIQGELERGEFPFRRELEDIHMHIEQALIERLGLRR